MVTASRALLGLSTQSLTGIDDAATISEFRALVVLGAHGPTRLNTLASRLHVRAPAASRTVDRVIAAGFAHHRLQQDTPDVVIALTPAGKQLVELVTRRRSDAIAAVMAAMPPDGRLDMVDVLVAFSAAGDEPLVTPASKLGE